MSKSGSSGLDRLSRMAENAVGDDPRAITFTRGLMLGALVGAALAGSTIWQRRHRRAALDSPPASPRPSGSGKPAAS